MAMNSKMSVQSSAFPDTRASQAWVLGFVAALLIFFVFREGLIELVRRWSAQEEYSHGFLIPFVTAWLLWVRRDALTASISRSSVDRTGSSVSCRAHARA